MTFTFSKDNIRQCFNVNILDDDDINEPEKIFLVVITTGAPQVTLSPDTATITIIGNDGKYQFQETKFIKTLRHVIEFVTTYYKL